jgi:hypothetical protein
MTIRSARPALLAVALLAPALPASAVDKWDAAFSPLCGDDDLETCNELWPGAPQTHDLEWTAADGHDVDHMVIETKAGRSYEVRVVSANVFLHSTSCAGGCVSFTRRTATTELQASVAPSGPGHVAGAATSIVARWTSGESDERQWIRVVAGGFTGVQLTAADQYEIELLDTTYHAARWNQVGTQSSVFVVQNASPSALDGAVRFYGPTGAVLHVQPFALPRNGVYVFGAGSVPALAGQSGSAAVVHTGGYGALNGKVVSLEPATGFAFDTPLVPVPR